ncbi:hypothetical protein BMS3Bbin04_01361 [bacterium BMS3Bbin04]|nr:hypothetical protein BMS3Bbin04_01361 [bacterium BMS3Bbin04]
MEFVSKANDEGVVGRVVEGHLVHLKRCTPDHNRVTLNEANEAVQVRNICLMHLIVTLHDEVDIIHLQSARFNQTILLFPKFFRIENARDQDNYQDHAENLQN